MYSEVRLVSFAIGTQLIEDQLSKQANIIFEQANLNLFESALTKIANCQVENSILRSFIRDCPSMISSDYEQCLT